MARTQQVHHHPNGLTYLFLWLGTWLIRLPALLGQWLVMRRALRELRSDVVRRRIHVPVRNSRQIIVDVYEKVGASERKKRRYVHVNFHGSGFMIPSLGTDIDFCAQLAAEGIVVFDVDYRKAPEHPFPAAYYDAWNVLEYIQAHREDFNTMQRVTVGGFSAGANLAMALAVTSRSTRVGGVVSFYGNTDMSRIYAAPDVKNYDSGIVLPDWLRAFFYKAYILPEQDRTNIKLSPAFAPSASWPKHVFCACGTADSLHEPARLLVQRLKNERHPDAEFASVEREAHSFDKNVKAGSETEKRRAQVYGQAIEMIKRANKR